MKSMLVVPPDLWAWIMLQEHRENNSGLKEEPDTRLDVTSGFGLYGFREMFTKTKTSKDLFLQQSPRSHFWCKKKILGFFLSPARY